MPELHFPFLSLCQTLENDTHLVEAFSFPEVIRFGSNPVRLREGLIRSLLPLLEQMPPGEVHRRLPPLEPVGGWVRLELSPPPQDPAWRTPVELTFPYLLFPHGPHRLAWVPTLGLVVVGAAPDQVEGRLVPEIRAELARRRASSSLASLGWLQRCRELSWHSEAVRLRLKSPREFLALEQPAEKRVLPEVATDLGANPPEPAFEMEADLARLARALGGTRPRSVLLVGPSGVGKTALVGELARRRAEFGLGATPFYETSGARLMAGSHGFGAWQDRCRKLWREVSSERAVLVLGNLVELMEVGRSADNPGGVAGFFRPHLARGELQAVAECTPEQLSHIELRDPHLLQAFWILRLEEPEPARARAILGRCARAWGPQEEDLEPLLAEVDRLHRRYATCSAYPGRPLRFLRTLLQGPGPWTARRATEEFSHETGLPLWLLDEGIPLDLEATRRWLAERVLGQPEAVDLVVDLIATVKAGLARPGRPLASLLFLGPTGVGKTEMARSLAEFFYQDRRRMVRFDMSEYSDPWAVQRLIGGAWDAHGLLTGKVRQQPFGVVLFDELEKADPSFFDLLLQILGDGRLTDGAGRLADFSNSVVLMTSNLGAQEFQRGPLGFVTSRQDGGEVRAGFLEAVREAFRPELLNRIDRLVSFAPLDRQTVESIARRQLERLAGREGLRFRDLRLEVEPQVASFLAREGFDRRYGARPLQRSLERQVLAPLAAELNRWPAETALEVRLRLRDRRLAVEVKPRTDSAGRRLVGERHRPERGQAAAAAADLRRRAEALARCPAAADLDAEIFRLQGLVARLQKRPYRGPEEEARLARLPHLRQVARSLAGLREQACTLEEEAYLQLHGFRVADPQGLWRRCGELEARRVEVLLDLYALGFEGPHRVTLAVYSEHPAGLFRLAEACAQSARSRGMTIQAVAYGTDLVPRPVEEALAYLSSVHPGVLGVGLRLEGRLALPLYGPERGLHCLEQGLCLVDTSGLPLEPVFCPGCGQPLPPGPSCPACQRTLPPRYLPPEGVHRRGFIGPQPRRRSYDPVQRRLEDSSLGPLSWSGEPLWKALDAAAEAWLLRCAEALVE